MLSLLFFILVFHNSNTPVGCLNNEVSALLSFKQSIIEDPENSLINWNSSDQTPCSWNGITCIDQKVVSLSIPKKRLYGSLSPALGSLPDLRHLNLRNNNFFGSLPIELFKVEGLQSLVLVGNSLSGSIPFEIGNLSYLQTLDLSHNFFNGSLPNSLVQCKRLKTLDLSQNNFTGPIPTDLGHLSNLQGTADFSHNLFNGSIPASLGNLPEKVYIDLSYNNLSGSIPQNGALINRGPTAFIGNYYLCGPPLKNPCSSDTPGANSPSSYPYLPNNSLNNATGKGGKSSGLSKSGVIAIVVSDVVGICLIGLLFSYCYSRVSVSKKRKDKNGFEKGVGKRNECLCFRNDDSDTLSDNVDQCDLVPLDSHVGFDLDSLLKASAFVLGKSGIGIVYKVVLEDGLALAVRRLGEGGSQRFKEFQTEVEAIGKLKHPNIVTLKAYYWSVEEKLLIYDYIPNGNLVAAIHGKTGIVSFTPLTWTIRLTIMKGIAKGLVYLHEYSPKKYVHGDVKPSNILLGQNMEPLISDFGLGRLANIAGGSSTLQSSRTQQGNTPPQVEKKANSAMNATSYYQAPEALKVVKPSQKWDVYSYGVILLEMICGRSPVIQVGPSEMDLVGWIRLCIEEKKPLSDVLDPFLAQDADKEEEMIAVLKIAMACIQSSPERRPAMRHVSDALERLAVPTD